MITAYIDGGARGNPGPAGYGVHVVDDQGNILAEIYEGIGHATNNVAEYRGLLAALEWSLDPWPPPRAYQVGFAAPRPTDQRRLPD